MMYPPVANMMAVLILSEDEGSGLEHAMKLTDEVRTSFPNQRVMIIGPTAASVGKINDVYRTIFYIKHNDYDTLVRIKDVCEQYIASNQWNRDSVQFDFNPMSGY